MNATVAAPIGGDLLNDLMLTWIRVVVIVAFAAAAVVAVAVFLSQPARPPDVDAETVLQHVIEDLTADPSCPSRFLDHHCTRTDPHDDHHNHLERLWWDTCAQTTETS